MATNAEWWVRSERLTNLADDLSAVAEDFCEFFPGEFADVKDALDRARVVVADAAANESPVASREAEQGRTE